MMKASLAFLRAHLGRVVDQVEQRGDRIVIFRNGRPVAALVRHSDYLALEDASVNAPDYKLWQAANKTAEFDLLYSALKRAAKDAVPEPKTEGDGMVVRDDGW